MKITILCSSEQHPINKHLQAWIRINAEEHDIDLIRSKSDLSYGDLLFLVSCSEIVGLQERGFYAKSLVIHASDLPLGRGWSPHIWKILDGETKIVVSLLEASDRVDSGDIWQKVAITIPAHALFNEINQLLFDAEIELMDFAVAHFDCVVPQPQAVDVRSSYYPKRTPDDSEINPRLSIAEQFDLMRVCDPQRFPAFFYLRNCRYKIVLEKMSDE